MISRRILTACRVGQRPGKCHLTMTNARLCTLAQVEKATKAAKAIIAQIKNSFRYFDADLVRLLYVSLVRPHLEFAVPVWNPYMKKDIEKL